MGAASAAAAGVTATALAFENAKELARLTAIDIPEELEDRPPLPGQAEIRGGFETVINEMFPGSDFVVTPPTTREEQSVQREGLEDLADIVTRLTAARAAGGAEDPHG